MGRTARFISCPDIRVTSEDTPLAVTQSHSGTDILGLRFEEIKIERKNTKLSKPLSGPAVWIRQKAPGPEGAKKPSPRPSRMAARAEEEVCGSTGPLAPGQPPGDHGHT